jgi:hypothetical protein
LRAMFHTTNRKQQQRRTLAVLARVRSELQ